MSLKESGLIGLPVSLRDKGALSEGSCHEATEGMIILSLGRSCETKLNARRTMWEEFESIAAICVF